MILRDTLELHIEDEIWDILCDIKVYNILRFPLLCHKKGLVISGCAQRLDSMYLDLNTAAHAKGRFYPSGIISIAPYVTDLVRYCVEGTLEKCEQVLCNC